MSRPRFPVPVFAAIGAGAFGPVQELRARPELRLVSSPRHASVLLVAGAVPPVHAEALDRVHDQVPHPRRTVVWVGSEGDHPMASTVVTGTADDVSVALVEAHLDVVGTPSLSEPDRLPDEEPNEWRGVGPHGQGGEGMMGGTPYGRPMAMTGHDRDGLSLDQLDLRLGPFLDALPPGLVLDVTLQGEVLQRVEVDRTTSTSPAIGTPLVDGSDASEGTRQGLRWLAHGLHVHGLDAHAARAAALAVDPSVDRRRAFGSLGRSIRRSGLLWALRGVGRIDGRKDAEHRWREGLDRIDAGLAGERPPVHAAPSSSFSDVSGALVGMTLTDAVATLVSLGPVPQAAAR